MGETRKLFSNSLIVIVGTLVASIFSYLFNMLMGRYLGPEQYGEMVALMSLLTIVAVAGGAILTITMRYSSELYAAKKFKALKKLFAVFSRYVYFFALAIILMLFIVIQPIADYFSITNLLPVIIAFTSLVFGLVIMVNKGLLQGGQKFTALSVVGILEMALRLALGIFLVKVGLEVSGALLAIVLSTAISYFLTFFPIRSMLKNDGSDDVSQKHVFDKKEIINYSWPALISAALLMITLNLDVILIKHYFPPLEAGTYAAISTIAKIILYVTAPIVAVMFPMISERKTKGDKHYSIFLFSLLFVVVGSLLILGLYVVAPAKVILFLYGNQYVNYFYLLPEVGLAFVLYSLINLMVNYYLVLKDFTFILFFALILILEIIAISFFHSSIILVVRIMILSLSLLFALFFGYYLFIKKEQIKLFFQGKY
jgi:O-antigen/teichoic acid export membrane protein